MWKHFAVNFKKYLALRGRSSRLEFWSFVTCSLMLLLVGVAITGIFYTLEHFSNLPIRLGSVNPATIGVILFFLTALILAMPFISVAVRRVHDVGLTGWLILIPGLNLILWCMPSKNRDNYFDDNNVFDPSRIIGLSLIWAGFIASFFYAIAAVFLVNGKLTEANLKAEEVQAMEEAKNILEENQTPQEDEVQAEMEENAFLKEIMEEESLSDEDEGYDGEIIQTDQLDDGTIITLRRHSQTLTVRMIQDTNVYSSIKDRIVVGSISIPQEVKVTGIAKTMNPLTTANTTEIWLRIDDMGFDGFLHVGPISDPYENDFYTVLDHFDFADEKWTVRNMGERFYAFKNGTEIYDAPGTRHSNKIGVIQVKGETSPEYSISAITEETTLDKESGSSYPWLRLDSDGKSGWIYGKYAVTKAGTTPEFPNPKRMLEQTLQDLR